MQAHVDRLPHLSDLPAPAVFDDVIRIAEHADQARDLTSIPVSSRQSRKTEHLSLGRPPDGVLRFVIAMAGGPCEHRRLYLEFEEVLLLTRRSQRGLGALVGELPCQAVPDLGMRDVAGHPAQIESVLVVFEGKRVHRIAPVAVEISLLWRRDDERIQPGFGEQWTHRMQPWSPVGPRSAEEGETDAVVVQQVGSLTGKFRLLGFEVAPRDHFE